MKIKRTSANKIMSQATRLTDNCLLGILDKQEKVVDALTLEELQKLMTDNPLAILIYNQHSKAIEIKDQIKHTDGQQLIEIFQDTEGVFGLRAYQQTGKIETPVTLEYSD